MPPFALQLHFIFNYFFLWSIIRNLPESYLEASFSSAVTFQVQLQLIIHQHPLWRPPPLRSFLIHILIRNRPESPWRPPRPLPSVLSQIFIFCFFLGGVNNCRRLSQIFIIFMILNKISLVFIDFPCLSWFGWISFDYSRMFHRFFLMLINCQIVFIHFPLFSLF